VKRARGTDLAMFQGDAPFAEMVTDGIEFSIAKATEGRGYIDPKWEQNLIRSPIYMRAVGCYHVLRAGTPLVQAAHHARQWERLVTEAAKVGAKVIPPCMDFEIMDKQTAEQAVGNCVEYRVEIERLTGCVPWLYSYPSFLREQCKNLAPSELAECPMWLAWYAGYGYSRAAEVDPIKALGKFAPTLWVNGRWVCWQYDGDKGERYPNGVDADFNVANGSVEDMLGLVAPEPSNGPDTQPETPTGKSSQTMRAVAATPLRAGEGEHTPIVTASEDGEL
jgi:GH25 family lysozyme M1 (1,4-beta-N-acetylmuramidase)